MSNEQYPSNTVEDLLKTDYVNQNTAVILKHRSCQQPINSPSFFKAEQFKILKSISERLIPQNHHFEKVDLAGMLDGQLAAGKGNGWRYSKMPPDGKAFNQGIKGIVETSDRMFGENFIDLDDAEQDAVLTAVQQGHAQGKIWEQMPAKLFFEELLTALAELYYSHPIAKNDIGDVSFADAKGWENIGLNKLDVQEPRLPNNAIQQTI